MSKMLEQAILDAEQLKEAAIKNAESALIEKYSDQIRTAVDTILEQDEMPVDLPIKEGGGCGCPSVCKCAEKEWWITIRVFTHLPGVGCIVPANTINTMYWKRLFRLVDCYARAFTQIEYTRHIEMSC